MQSRFQEGVELFRTAAQQLATLEPSPARDLVSVTILALLGWLYIRTAQLELAATVLEESLVRAQLLQLPPMTGLGTDPRLALGILTLLWGEYPRAIQLGQAALATAEEHNQRANAEFALSVLAHTAFVQGELELAQHYSERGLALAQSHDERWFSAYALNLLGQIASARQEETRALGYLAASYARREEFNDREGMARALHLQGNVHIQQGQWEKAQACYRQALMLYEQIQDLGGVVNVHTQLGNLALTINDQPAARYHLGQALQRIGEQQLVTHLFPVLLGVGELFLKQRWAERGVALLVLALHHPASEQDAKRRAAQILTQQRATLPQSELALMVAQAQATDLVALTSRLRIELASSLAAADLAAPDNGETDRHVEQIDKLQLQQQAAAALVEPLTRRELEILHLLAAGLSNEQIANQLIVAIGTVKAHTAQIYGKLGVNSRTQAVTTARKLGLITD
jgi:ATP/maltotriose-dependent transcriptional regulator MalT